MAWFWRNYLGSAPTGEPLAEPLHAELAGLPPVYLALAAVDPLADDTRELARRLAAADVAHECREYPGAGSRIPADDGAVRRPPAVR